MPKGLAVVPALVLGGMSADTLAVMAVELAVVPAVMPGGMLASTLTDTWAGSLAGMSGSPAGKGWVLALVSGMRLAVKWPG
jgi:hypothetical protein